ncbi:hypothetical protein [Veronia nyctiphanis]|nr:hypothetical protein [Veronia nyctiphanis]
MEKNRYKHPSSPRDFIFNDMIHVVDSLNILGDTSPDSIHVNYLSNMGMLSKVNISWESRYCLFSGSMNREYGKTIETLEFSTANKTYQFSDFFNGVVHENESSSMLNLPEWSDILYAKGFYAMIEEWIRSIKVGKVDSKIKNRDLNTHYVCEYLVKKVEK